MPRRSPLSLDDVSDLPTLAAAFWRASRGRTAQPDVAQFAADLPGALAQLGADLRANRAPEGRWTRFVIHDPKRREILAPCFRDRVAHHAVMAHAGPVLDRSLVADTFACRTGKGTLAAVQRAQRHLRRWLWHVQIDIRSYFASIDHGVLRRLLHRRFKHPALLAWFAAVLARTPDGPGCGLPIGALTSQHLANLALAPLDRFLLESLRVRGMVRYMDDIVWWCDDREAARRTLAAVRAFADQELRLEVKPTARIQRSHLGLSFLGFRILPDRLRLLRRRRRRYAAARRRAERAFLVTGDADALQRAHAAALAITAHADAVAWRRGELRRRPPVDA